MLVLGAADAAREGRVRDVVDAGVDWIQLRERGLASDALLAAADALRAAAPDACLLVNRRCDVAWAAGADGVHLGFDGADPADARALLGDAAWIGVSTHAPGEIDPKGGASYAHLAPVFDPLSKPAERPALGPAAITAAAARGLPVIAQGGIDARNARTLIEAGAAGVAVTGAILQAPDPARAARALRSALDA